MRAAVIFGSLVAAVGLCACPGSSDRDLCAGVSCAPGRVCVEGDCEPDPSCGGSCAAGELCVAGYCVPTADVLAPDLPADAAGEAVGDGPGGDGVGEDGGCAVAAETLAGSYSGTFSSLLASGTLSFTLAPSGPASLIVAGKLTGTGMVIYPITGTITGNVACTVMASPFNGTITVGGDYPFEGQLDGTAAGTSFSGTWHGVEPNSTMSLSGTWEAKRQ